MRFPVFVKPSDVKSLTESDVGWNFRVDMFEKSIQTYLITTSTAYEIKFINTLMLPRITFIISTIILRIQISFRSRLMAVIGARA